jgi:hypothetical protein
MNSDAPPAARVITTRSLLISGHHIPAGCEIKLSVAEAQQLCQSGWARPLDDGPAEAAIKITGDVPIAEWAVKSATVLASPPRPVRPPEFKVGGAIKAAADGRLGGLAIVFSDENTPDASKHNHNFDKSTDLERFIRQGPLDILLHHAIAEDTILGEGTLTPGADGVRIDAKLDLTVPAAKAAHADALAGRLSWSTGSVSHLVRREARPNGTNRLARWPVAEVSLTESPAEKRARATVPAAMKADLAELFRLSDDLDADMFLIEHGPMIRQWERDDRREALAEAAKLADELNYLDLRHELHELTMRGAR